MVDGGENGQAQPDEPQWMTPAEIAAEFRLSVETIRRWIRNGQLPAVRPGQRALIVRRVDVQALIERGTTAGKSAAARDAAAKNVQRPFTRGPMPLSRVSVDQEVS
jgi:excisionase family DNA binding protein